MSRRSRAVRRAKIAAEDGGGGENGEQEPLDLDMELDMIQQRTRKRYPIIPLDQKEVNTHNLATLPSLKTDGDSSFVVDAIIDSNDAPERKRAKVEKRINANSLIESRNKFRQLLGQTKPKPNSNYSFPKPENNFDGYVLKTRKVKYDSKKHKKDNDKDGASTSKPLDCEFQVFGRKIDLSGFANRYGSTQFVPMYPLCRLWAMSDYSVPDSLVMKRQPPVPLIKTDTLDPDGPYSDQPVDVVHLPKAEPNPVNEQGDPICLRIPQAVRNFIAPKQLDVQETLNSMVESSAEDLIKMHKTRWRLVRGEFRKAAEENDKRYAHSFSVLKSMHSKAMLGNKNLVQFYKYPPYETEENIGLKHADEPQPAKTD